MVSSRQYTTSSCVDSGSWLRGCGEPGAVPSQRSFWPTILVVTLNHLIWRLSTYIPCNSSYMSSSVVGRSHVLECL
jgi:hypothetical protein